MSMRAHLLSSESRFGGWRHHYDIPSWSPRSTNYVACPRIWCAPQHASDGGRYRRRRGGVDIPGSYVVKPPLACGVPRRCVRCRDCGGADSGAGCPRGGCPARLTCTLCCLSQLVANNFVSRLSHKSGESSAAGFARVHRPATFSRILPPRTRCCTASWICSRGCKAPSDGTPTKLPGCTTHGR
jgi:hypothetical protein